MIARSSAAVVLILFLLSAERIRSMPASVPGTELVPEGACPPTITQSSSQEITLGNSLSCNIGGPNFYHREASYWRAFNMTAANGSQQYIVTSVSIGIEDALSGSGQGQPLTIRLYTNAGAAFPGGSKTEIATTSVTVIDQTGTILAVPLSATVPEGTLELVMEVLTPDGLPDGNSCFLGSNAAAQSGPSYVSSTFCGPPDPIDTGALHFPDCHFVFNIHGTCGNGLTAKAINISTRLRVEPGDNAMIAGFLVTGNAPKTVIMRGMGPSLAGVGITDVLSDPVLELHGPDGASIYTNNDWRDDSAQAAQIQGTAYQPGDDRESAMIQTLAPGAYTAVLTGRNQGSGVALVEVYDNNQTSDSQLGNLSTRGFVQTGNNVMIGGFILGGDPGNAHIAIRCIGPSLSQAGLSNVLADPTLELYDSNGTAMVSNDNWRDDPSSASQLSSFGLALPNDLESGIFASLAPGAYTAILSGKDGGSGIGLIELYNFH